MIAFFDEEKKISLCAVRTNSYFMQYCNTVSLYSNFSPGFNGLQSLNNTFSVLTARVDRLCGLVVRVSDYRYRGPGFDSRRYQIFWVLVGLERGPLSLVRSTEELLE